MNLQEAIGECRKSELTGWELVAFSQRLVNRNMKYSVENSLDSPETAFAKGQGYCWHRAKILDAILRELGFESRLVHAFRNRFSQSEIAGVIVKDFVSGHVWVRVNIDGVEKDVCPGHPDNAPGVMHFVPLSKVLPWNRGIEILTYYGSALVNLRRGKKFGKIRRKQIDRWNPDRCPCKKTSCPRYKNCDACKEYHDAKNGRPSCER